MIAKYGKRYGYTQEQIQANPSLRQLLHDKINSDIFIASQQAAAEAGTEEEPTLETETEEQPQTATVADPVEQRKQYYAALDQFVDRNLDQNQPGDVVFVPGAGNGRYYTALGHCAAYEESTSTCVPDSPLAPAKLPDHASFPTIPSNLPVTWQDTGTTAPAAVAGGQPADQTVSLLNAPLPQTHSLSYFNIASGFVVSFTRPPTFGYTLYSTTGSVKLPSTFVPATSGPTNMNLAVEPTTGCTISTVPNKNGTTPVYYCPFKTGHGSYPADPVLGLTLYIPPIDAEVPFRPKNPRNWIPAPSVAFSLANPTNNFYLGASSEFLVRNVQVLYGLALLKAPVALGTPASQNVWGGVGTAPTVSTQQGFLKAPFAGFTFNLSGFIQSLGFGSSKGQ